MTGLLLIVVLAVALTTAVNWQQRGARRFADEREAIRFAERVLSDLQMGRAAPPPTTRPASAETQISIEPRADTRT